MKINVNNPFKKLQLRLSLQDSFEYLQVWLDLDLDLLLLNILIYFGFPCSGLFHHSGGGPNIQQSMLQGSKGGHGDGGQKYLQQPRSKPAIFGGGAMEFGFQATGLGSYFRLDLASILLPKAFPVNLLPVDQSIKPVSQRINAFKTQFVMACTVRQKDCLGTK